MRMKDRVVIITGGGTGIGRGISEKFAEAGAKVYIVYASSKDAAEETAAGINGSGGSAIAYQTDVTDEDAVKRMFGDISGRDGRIDVLVNNAGWSKRIPHNQLDDLTDDVWDRTLNTNLRGAFYCMRAAAPYLRKNPGSSIINIASIAPYSGQGSSIVYAASKAGLISMTKSLARVLAPEVRVNAIAPGFVRTRFDGWPKETFDEAEKRSALGRISSAEEIGAAAVFLALDGTAITGETINVDTGQTAIGRIL